jgi:predicted alpha/beta superfamily hydrolase
MKPYLSALTMLLCASAVSAQLPQVASGTLERFENFPSQYVSSRNVEVWLPEGYSARKKYAVLYMHDGQMLFDSTITWNSQEWQVDEVMSQLLREERIRGCIVVGIWNSGQGRHADYFPQKPFEQLLAAAKDSIYAAGRANGYAVFGDYEVQSDNYLKFIVSELKPFIDQRYATRRGRKGTFIMGSSMGGLISMYAICEYPRVFGGAACLSTHWPGIFTKEDNPIPGAFLDYLKAHLPSPKQHKLYFDHGTLNLDAWYAPYDQQAGDILRAGGYSAQNGQVREFPGEDHSERSWAKRLHIPLEFLLGR